VDISVHRTFGEVALTENSYSQHSCFTCSTVSRRCVSNYVPKTKTGRLRGPSHPATIGIDIRGSLTTRSGA